MKYIVLIVDGASGWELPERGGKTCLELARTPNLDTMAKESVLGMVRTVPEGMEPSSACACMSLFGYDPKLYYRGRASIEARSMGIPVEEGEVVFRCNLVAVRDGKMFDYSAGHISTEEARQLIQDRAASMRTYATGDTQSRRGRLFEILADLTDEDGAYVEMEDLPDDLFDDWA